MRHFIRLSRIYAADTGTDGGSDVDYDDLDSLFDNAEDLDTGVTTTENTTDPSDQAEAVDAIEQMYGYGANSDEINQMFDETHPYYNDPDGKIAQYGGTFRNDAGDGKWYDTSQDKQYIDYANKVFNPKNDDKIRVNISKNADQIKNLLAEMNRQGISNSKGLTWNARTDTANNALAKELGTKSFGQNLLSLANKGRLSDVVLGKSNPTSSFGYYDLIKAGASPMQAKTVMENPTAGAWMKAALKDGMDFATVMAGISALSSAGKLAQAVNLGNKGAIINAANLSKLSPSQQAALNQIKNLAQATIKKTAGDAAKAAGTAAALQLINAKNPTAAYADTPATAAPVPSSFTPTTVKEEAPAEKKEEQPTTVTQPTTVIEEKKEEQPTVKEEAPAEKKEEQPTPTIVKEEQTTTSQKKPEDASDTYTGTDTDNYSEADNLNTPTEAGYDNDAIAEQNDKIVAQAKSNGRIGLSEDPNRANYNVDDWNRGMTVQSNDLVSDERCKKILSKGMKVDPTAKMAVVKIVRALGK